MKRILALLLLLGLSGAPALCAESKPAAFTNAYDAIALFTKVLEEVRRSYVDIDEAGYDQLIRHALTGMLNELDPYSQFMSRDSYENMRDDTSGHFGGIGIVIEIKNHLLTIVSPMEDTPGFHAGLQSGDIIVEIEGEETRDLSLSGAVDRLRGEPGTDVTIKTLRPSTRDIEEITITREEINIASVKDAELLENQIGYIRITQFSEPSGEALKTEVQTLVNEGMEALVIDLRGNPGGLLTAAAETAELFLRRGELIVYTQGRAHKNNKQVFKASGGTHWLDFPIAILINGASASASEIVAGALQDHKRAVLIGEKTFGKGSVQSVLPLEDGSAVKLTTAKYYTPSERVIHENGIEPDIVIEMSAEDFYKIRRQQARKNGEAGEEEESESEVRDVQLDYALGTLKGMLIQQDWAE